MGENEGEAEVGEGSENVGFETGVDKAESQEPGPADKETPGEGNGDEIGLEQEENEENDDDEEEVSEASSSAEEDN